MTSTLNADIEKVAKRLRKGWCRYAFAVTARGRVVGAQYPNAARWCVRGAAIAEGVEPRWDRLKIAFKATHGGRSPMRFNDALAKSGKDMISALLACKTTTKRKQKK